MRQGNPNKRLRGRNRKGPNPLTKTFESNGPDVKIRGTALHIAEKYLQLSRDAQASGDRVMGENYLQHAEHYFRILAAAQGPNQQQQQQPVQRDDDQAETAAEHRGTNGSGQADPAHADQPSDSGFERQAMNGSRPKTNGSDAAPFEGEAETASSSETPDDDGAEAEQAAGAAGESGEAAEAKPRRRSRTTRSPRSRSRRTASSDSEPVAEGAAPQDGETASSDA